MKRIIILFILFIPFTILFPQTSNLIIQSGHTALINSVAFSPDGKFFASAGKDGLIILWDSRSNKQIRTFKGHQSGVSCVRFSPDGNFLYSSGELRNMVINPYIMEVRKDFSLRKWDVNTGKEIFLAQNHDSSVTSIDVSPDGKQIISSGKDNRIIIWDSESGDMIYGFSADYPAKVCFMEDGYFISLENNSKINLRDSKTGSIIRQIYKSEKYISDFSVSANQKYCAASADSIFIIDIENNSVTDTIIEKSNLVVFSNDSKYLIYTNQDFINVYDLSGKQNIFDKFTYIDYKSGIQIQIQVPVFNESEIYIQKEIPKRKLRYPPKIKDSELLSAIYISKDDSKIITAYRNFTEPEMPWQMEQLHIKVSYESQFEYSKEGLYDNFYMDEFSIVKFEFGKIRYIFSELTEIDTIDMENFPVVKGRFKYFKGEIEKLLNEIKGFVSPVYTANFNNQSKGLLISLKNRTSLHFNPDNNLLREIKLKTIPKQKGIDFNHEFFGFTEDYDKPGYAPVNPKDTVEKQVYEEILGTTDEAAYLKLCNVEVPSAAAISNDRKFAAVASYDSSLFLVKLSEDNAEKNITIRLIGHQSAINSVIFSPDSKYLYSAGWDNTIFMWDTESGSLLKVLEGHTNSVMDIDISEDGKYLLSASNDKTVIIWDTEIGIPHKIIDDYSHPVTFVRFNNDGTKFLSGGSDNTIRVTDLITGNTLKLFKGHEATVMDACFISGENYILSASYDNSFRIWDADNQNELCRIIIIDNNDWAAVTLEGHFDVSDGGMNHIHWVLGNEPVDLSQVKEKLYEPGLLQKILGINDEKIRTDVKIEELKSSPEIEISYDEKNENLVRVNLKNSGGGIGVLKVLVNGKEAYSGYLTFDKETNIDSAKFEYDVKNSKYLVSGTNTIEFIAYNGNGDMSSRGEQLLYYNDSQDEPVKKTFYGIIIGTSDYEGEGMDLRFSSKDAEDFGFSLRLGAETLFGKENTNIKIFSSSGNEGTIKPEKQHIIKAFEEFYTAKPDDILAVYLAGHGVNAFQSKENEDFFYLTENAKSFDIESSADYPVFSISSKELSDLMLKVPAVNQVLILDVCSSGKIIDNIASFRQNSSTQIWAIERMKSRCGVHILTGCAADAVSYEANAYSQGLLTYSLLMGLRGEALDYLGSVDVSKLFQYSARKVPELAKNLGGIQQPRVFGLTGFDIGLIKKADREKIPLATPKPIIQRTTFQDADLFIDKINLSEAVDNILNEISHRGKNSSIVFINVKDFPGAYILAGVYKTEGNNINVKFNLFKDNQKIKSFEITENFQDAKTIAEKIILLIEDKLTPQN